MRTLSFCLLAAVAAAAAVATACGSEHLPAQIVDDAGAPDAAADALPPLEGAPPAKIAADKELDATSAPVIFDRLRGGVWTANGDVGTVSYVDVDARKVVQEIPIGKDVRGVALSPDFRWIAAVDRGQGSVALIDAESRDVKRTLAVGGHPRAAVWDAEDPRWVYVAVEDDDAVVVIDRVAGAVAKSIAVGRMPSGVAVSRARRELYVTHRIDGKVSVVDLATSAVSDVPLADEPANDDATVPQGKPFAFESLAWAPDGNVAWLPHELLAPFHPFQFQRVLFPSVSVVDLGAKAEVQTDPADPLGVIAGRKNLFAGINVLDSTGNTTILSQPCAAAIHPNGFVAYVVACASEDLVVFDTTAGIAVDLVQDLPGDHPMGIALDDTGQRAWILSDQSEAFASKSLQMIDLAGGDLTKHVKLAGDPIGLVAKDPLPADLRTGSRLWYRANSSKGDLAITGNDWMSCGGCHLDGLQGGNKIFFDALRAKDPTKDAQIGHVGMKDLFSTAPTPASVDPHDLVVAMLDQGGLAPDRTGAKRDGAVDPNAPNEKATAMARALAQIVARDLPIGPSWLLFPGDKPNPDYDGQWCGNCHKAEYDAWQKSVHAHAAQDPMVLHCADAEEKTIGPQFRRHCAGCHDPVSARLGQPMLDTKEQRGITCLGCHDTERLIRAGGNADFEARAHDWTKDHKAWGLASLERLRKPEFCGTCHEQFVPGTAVPGFTTFSEYEKSPYAGTDTRCVDCHMPKNDQGVADHSAPGGNVYMGTKYGDAALVTAQKQKLKLAISLKGTKVDGGVMVLVTNKGAGHSFPTGVTDVREPWVEVDAVDANGNVVENGHFGGPATETDLLPPNAARLGMDIAKADGTLLFEHELSVATRIPYDLHVEAGGTESIFVPVPASLPAGTDHLEAVLYYRNVRTPYYRLATQTNGAAPQTEVARAKIP